MMSLALLVCMAALAVMMQSASSQDIPTVLIVGGSKDNNKATTLKCTNTKTNKTLQRHLQQAMPSQVPHPVPQLQDILLSVSHSCCYSFHFISFHFSLACLASFLVKSFLLV
jgi:hypothetical protein